MRRFVKLVGLIASPPCPAFSKGGQQTGVDELPRIIEYLEANSPGDANDDYADGVLSRDAAMVLEPFRWIEETKPEWVALEQVPPVLPVWEAGVRMLTRWGYSAWCGLLNAADYGVPQTRTRAILIASKARRIYVPEATHGQYPQASLFGAEPEPWISVDQALDGVDGWQLGFPRVDDLGTSPTGYRERDTRSTDEPALTLTEKARSWTFTRPATTISCDPRMWPPGHKVNQADRDRLAAAANELYGDRAGTDAIRLTVAQGLTLQSFPADHPTFGSKTAQWRQIGNAVPPLLAERILEAVA